MSDMRGGAEPVERQAGSWLRPPTEDNDLRRYLTTLRDHRLLVFLCVVIAALAALAYVEVSKPVYQAQADLIIVPANVSGDIAVAGLPLIQQSSDPTRDVETASELIATTDVALGVNAALHLHATAQQTLLKVSALPVAQSNIVAITATGSSARAAARLANAFATGVIVQRTALFHSRLDSQIALLTKRITASPGLAGRLSDGLSQLQTLRTGPLPDMRVATLAQPPTAPSSPRKTLSIAVGILAGLLIGLVAAFARDGLDSRVQREEQLRRLFQLPVLGRIPREGATTGMARTLARVPLIGWLARWSLARSSHPRSPLSLSPAGLDGYRTLRATLLASRRVQPRTVLVTSAGPSEGKTTSAINLAVSLAWSGASVILIEADLRRPSVAGALGLTSSYDLADVLTGQVSIERALVQPDEYGGNLRVLLAGGHGVGSAFVGDELLLPAASELLTSAQELADYVIIDSPPLAQVIDALELARQADEVLLVVRLGHTQTARLRRLGGLLARTGVQPAGIAVIGTDPPRASERYPYQYPYLDADSLQQATGKRTRVAR
jgi:capsular exopolysaccharide synthesis family protein